MVAMLTLVVLAAVFARRDRLADPVLIFNRPKDGCSVTLLDASC
jgi:hypothetical protein